MNRGPWDGAARVEAVEVGTHGTVTTDGVWQLVLVVLAGDRGVGRAGLRCVCVCFNVDNKASTEFGIIHAIRRYHIHAMPATACGGGRFALGVRAVLRGQDGDDFHLKPTCASWSGR